MSFARRQWPVLFLALLPLIVLWKAVFLGQCIGPWDQIMQMAPWNQAKPSSAWDVLQADGVLQFYGWRDLVFDAWRKGDLPFWNPYQLCGTPLLANSQSAGFYPLHILMGLLGVPTALAITLLAWFHLAWACIGTRWLAKLLGANELGAMIAGASFGLSAFMVSWTPLASVVTTCSWIPWVLCFAVLLTVTKSERDAWVRHFLGLVGCITMMLLGGHLQFAAYGLIALFVFGLARAIQQRSSWRAYALCSIAVATGFLLAAPQVIPTLAFSQLSSRKIDPTPEGASAYVSGALQISELTGFVVPSFTGLPGQATESGTPSYWPALVKRGAAFAEGALSVGPLVFGLLFLLDRRKFALNWPILLTVLIGLLLALGPLSYLMYLTAPGWSSTGSPGRACFIAVLALCVLAGCLLPNSMEPKDAKKFALAVLAGTIGSWLLVTVVSASAKSWVPGVESVEPIAKQVLKQAAVFGLLPSLLVGGTFLLAQSRLSAAAAAAIVLVTLCGSAFCLPTGTPYILARKADVNVRNAFINSDWQLLGPAKALMPGNMATMNRLIDVGGYDSLLSRETLEMLRTVNSGQDPAPPANGNMMFVKPGFNLDALKDAGVSKVWSLKPLEGFASQPSTESALVYTIPNVWRASTPAGKASITVDGYSRQTIDCVGPGTLTVRDRNLPGWSATLDGQPVETASGLWRHVEVPGGRHQVRFVYDPPGFRKGLLLACTGLLICATAFSWALFRRIHRLRSSKTPKIVV